MLLSFSTQYLYHLIKLRVLLDTNNISILNPGRAKHDSFVSSIL